MPDFNASVTVTPEGRLTLGSMVTVEVDGSTVAFNEVLQLSPVGGVLFWHRVNDALREVGWRPAYNSIDAHVHDGDVIRFNAEPVA